MQPFKKGPDYIDPMWLTSAAGRSCHNLDFYTMGHDEILSTFARYTAADTDIALIEGNKGLYDGLDLDGSNSNAALAVLLHAPVVLVIDARGMTRGIAPLILGYQAFDRGVDIAGIVLNMLGGSRHENKLRSIIEHYTDVPVIGALHRDTAIEISERHLGLIPSNEGTGAQAAIARIAETVAAQVDIGRVLEISRIARPIQLPVLEAQLPSAQDVRVGIARDAAFGFYYPGDLAAMTEAGAELVYFDTLRDKCLPNVDALFIGGGFPETHAARLTANVALQDDIRRFVEDGMPVYAECGGLMYLARTLSWNGQQYAMTGAVPADVTMQQRPAGRGYVRLRDTGFGPWPLLDEKKRAVEFPAHEFHYSRLENLGSDVGFAYEVLRGTGINGRHDGLIYKNVLGSYAHLRDTRCNRWTHRFIDHVRQYKHARSSPYSAGKEVDR